MTLRPTVLINRFTRVECRTPRAEIFRFGLDFCQISRKYCLTCNLGQKTIGHLDFMIDRRDRIIITDSSYMFGESASCIEDMKFNSDPALEVTPAFRKRGIAHALLGVLVQWGKSEGLTGITIPKGYHENVRNLDRLGFRKDGPHYALDFTPQLTLPVAIQ